jgi:hypothetical protein
VDSVFRLPIAEVTTITEVGLNDVAALQLTQPVDQKLVGFLGLESDWTM